MDLLLPWKRDFVSLACFGDVILEIRQHGIVAYRAFFFGIDSDALKVGHRNESKVLISPDLQRMFEGEQRCHTERYRLQQALDLE